MSAKKRTPATKSTCTSPAKNLTKVTPKLRSNTRRKVRSQKQYIERFIRGLAEEQGEQPERPSESPDTPITALQILSSVPKLPRKTRLAKSLTAEEKYLRIQQFASTPTLKRIDFIKSPPLHEIISELPDSSPESPNTYIFNNLVKKYSDTATRTPLIEVDFGKCSSPVTPKPTPQSEVHLQPSTSGSSNNEELTETSVEIVLLENELKTSTSPQTFEEAAALYVTPRTAARKMSSRRGNTRSSVAKVDDALSDVVVISSDGSDEETVAARSRARSKKPMKRKPTVFTPEQEQQLLELFPVPRTRLTTAGNFVVVCDGNETLGIERRKRKKIEHVPMPRVSEDKAHGTNKSPVHKKGCCNICFEKLGVRDMSATICGHIFCRECIQKAWNISKACPVCRKKLTKKNIFPLYT